MVVNIKGQGALEYLLLIGGAVLVAIIVISFMANLAGDQTENAPSPFVAQCAVLNEARCTTDFTRDIDGDGTFDCTWVTALTECNACKGDQTAPGYNCPATS